MWLVDQILQVDFIPLLTILYLLILMKANDAYEHDLNKFFYNALYLLLFLLIFDNIDYYYSNQEHVHFLHRFVLLTGFALRVALLRSEVMFLRREKVTKRENLILLIPLVITVLLMISGLFFDHVVWLDEKNVLHREAFSYVPHAVSLSYYFYSLYIAAKRFAAGRKVEGMILFISLFAAVVAILGEIIFRTRGLLVSVISMMLAFYYLYLHLENFKKDNLTGVLNRSTFFADINSKGNEKIIALGEFDLNDLKKINDQQGHDEGDKAIVTVARTILENLPPACRLYRMGGDEFVVLFYSVSWDDANALAEKIKKAFRQTEYSCAVGLAPWDGVNAFKESYKLADRRMYEDKEHQKAMLIDALR